MWFAYPQILLGLIMIPAIIYWRYKKGWGKPSSIFYPELQGIKKIFNAGRRPGSGLRETTQLIILGLLILAAARPQVATSARYYQTSGLDIMLGLDISGSMSARDFDPLDRLQAAKLVLKDFLSKANQDRIGLVAFAARAYHVCPLTVDYKVLLMLLDHLEIGMTSDGTALGMAITAAVNRLKESSAKSRVIILLTDGKNNAGQLDPLTAAEIAAAFNIRIYTIGIGREGGAPIMVKDATGGNRLLLDADGSIHYEKIEEETLIKISELTNARYFRATDIQKLSSIYGEIRTMERSRLSVKQFHSSRDIGLWLLGLALMLFLADQWLGLTIEKRIP